MWVCARAIVALLIMSSVAVVAAQTDQAVTATVADTQSSDPEMDLGEVIALLKQQQKDLARQNELLQAQAQQIASLKNELDVLRAPASPVATRAVATAGPEGEAGGGAGAGAGAGTVTSAGSVSDLDSGTKETIATRVPADEPQTAGEVLAAAGESVSQAQTDDPTRALLSQFVGAWRLPGTDAALRIGGYVKTDIVYNFDPLEISDRFIVGSIPVGVSEETADVSSAWCGNTCTIM